ncbi:MAG TPA: TetR/AcrR family transcriptional regulator [Syntrophus sp. (in: bacteria)]|nr:TetR/AcrR family transcriptional regulator [Syntrophus sp. (in: bacteria)]
MEKKKQQTRSRILDAAEALILESGIEEVTIAKIAERAQVADSLAYKYFKGKNDIIFSVVAERIREELSLLREQLQGIVDPKSQLSKMIWHMLQYNDSHRNHVTNFLFRCRSNKDFYKSDAYLLMKEYEGILTNILEAGAREGVFRNDLDLRLVRHIVFGTIDIEALNCTVTGEIENSGRDLDDIMALLVPMLTMKGRPAVANRKRAIMLAAEKIFARDGYADAKIAAIAETAQVAEGTIYEYFSGKEDLLFALADMNLNAYLDRVANIFQNKGISPPAEKLWRLMRSFGLSFLSIQDFMTIYFMDTLFNRRYYQTAIQPRQNEFARMLGEVIEAGKTDGSFRETINPRVFWYMFLGSYTHLALRWIIIDHKEFDKYTEVRRLMTLMMTAALKEPPNVEYLIKIEF